MYFLLNMGDIPASYVSLPDGTVTVVLRVSSLHVLYFFNIDIWCPPKLETPKL